VRHVLSVLRRDDRLDELISAVGVLATSTGRMVDEAVADIETPQYAKAKTAVCHLGVLAQLARMVSPAETDAFSRFLAELGTPTRVEPRSSDWE
jgi:hypothetical protein